MNVMLNDRCCEVSSVTSVECVNHVVRVCKYCSKHPSVFFAQYNSTTVYLISCRCSIFILFDDMAFNFLLNVRNSAIKSKHIS